MTVDEREMVHGRQDNDSYVRERKREAPNDAMVNVPE